MTDNAVLIIPDPDNPKLHKEIPSNLPEDTKVGDTLTLPDNTRWIVKYVEHRVALGDSHDTIYATLEPDRS